MNIESLREYCLSKPNTEETTPFGPDTLVYKVNGKMFLLTGLDEEQLSFNVKCDPQLREEPILYILCELLNFNFYLE